jgi:hypothetical protein
VKTNGKKYERAGISGLLGKQMTKHLGHNSRYFENDALIKKAYIKVLEEQKRMPTLIEVGVICSLSSETVRQHLNAINLNELIEPFKLFGSDVLAGLKAKAESGDAQAAKLFFFLIFDKVERKEIKADIKADINAKVKVSVKIPDAIAKRIGDELAKE